MYFLFKNPAQPASLYPIIFIRYYNTTIIYTTIIRGSVIIEGFGIRHMYSITDPPVYSCKYNVIENIK